jgi:hypothetical protein
LKLGSRALFTSTLKTALVASVISTCLVAMLFVANFYSLGLGGRQTVDRAFASGDLTDQDFLRGDSILGYHQYNDCLILGMALDQRYSRAELTISPSMPFGKNDVCMNLQAGRPFTDRLFYHNYIHGQTALARYLLPLMSVEQIRTVYRLTLSLILVCGIAISLLRFNIVFLIVLLALARAFGLQVFGQSLGHAPSDIVLGGFITFLAFRTGQLSERTAVIAAAVFGAMTMIFEMMTGGLPLGLAATSLIWFALKRPNVWAVASGAIAFTVSAATCLAIKYACVAKVFGPKTLLGVVRDLLTRTDGPPPVFTHGRTFAEALLGNTEAMMPGLGPMAGMLLILAIGLGALAMVRRPTLDSRILALSNLPIFGWFVVFHQHTIVHAWFMDRMLAWPLATGFAIYALSLRLERDLDSAVVDRIGGELSFEQHRSPRETQAVCGSRSIEARTSGEPSRPSGHLPYLK